MSSNKNKNCTEKYFFWYYLIQNKKLKIFTPRAGASPWHDSCFPRAWQTTSLLDLLPLVSSSLPLFLSSDLPFFLSLSSPLVISSSLPLVLSNFQTLKLSNSQPLLLLHSCSLVISHSHTIIISYSCTILPFSYSPILLTYALSHIYLILPWPPPPTEKKDSGLQSLTFFSGWGQGGVQGMIKGLCLHKDQGKRDGV